MNPVILWFAAGTSFFVGIAMALAADLLLLHSRMGSIRPVLTALFVTGVVFVVISATPLSTWAYLVWFVATAVPLVVGNLAACSRSVRLVSAGLVVVAAAAFGLAEFPYHRLPHIGVSRGTTVYVLGDSISAGMGTKQKCWPTVLTGLTSLSVVNLAQPGATCRSALKQVDGITETKALIIVEIGGNDMLGNADSKTFRDQLDLLLSSIQSHQHRVLMLELPLLPFQNAFGEAQRAVAAKHGVSLLPKRCFAAVLGAESGTLDGLHLSQVGHDAMARVIANVIQEE